MRIAYLTLSILTASLTVLANQTTPGWHASMRTFSEVLAELIPQTLSSRPLTDTDKQGLKDNIQKLSQLSHRINAAPVVPSRDRSIRIVSREFKAEADEIKRLIEKNRWEDVRPRAYQLSLYCIGCHTLNTAASSDYTADFKAPTNTLTHFEKAQFYTAIRQFEKAIIQFEYALTDSAWIEKHPQDWNNGFMMLLAVVTHTKKDPNLSLELISRFFDAKTYPQQLKAAAHLWRLHAKEWQSEAKKAATLSDVEKWVLAASKLDQPPHGGLFLLLRASSRLHEILGAPDKPSDEQHALYLAGIVGHQLAEFNLLYFPDQYLESCVRLNPKNEIAKQCFSELKKGWLSRFGPGEELTRERKATLSELERLTKG